MKVLLLDAYDSFVFTIAHYYKATGAQTRTIRVNDFSIEQFHSWKPDLLVLGPGPGTPEDHGYPDVLRAIPDDQAVFGVCLGFQAIGEHFGWQLTRAPRVQHGTYSEIEHDARGVFAKVPAQLKVVRYHSLALQPNEANSPLLVSAVSEADGVIMALRHRHRPIEGVQFHPESVGTEAGMQMIVNSLDLAEYRSPSSRKEIQHEPAQILS